MNKKDRPPPRKGPPAINLVVRAVDKDNLAASIEAAVSIFGENDREGIEHEFKASVGLQPERDVTTKDYNIDKLKFFVVYEDGKLVGMSGYYCVKGHDEDAWLDWMGVSPAYQNRGIGTVMIKEAFKRAAQDLPGIKNFRIWTTLQPEYAAARHLYRKFGFTEEAYKADAKDAARMVVIYSKAANLEQNGTHFWKDSPYPLDCDYHTVPEMNEKMGFSKNPRPAGSASPRHR